MDYGRFGAINPQWEIADHQLEDNRNTSITFSNIEYSLKNTHGVGIFQGDVFVQDMLQNWNIYNAFKGAIIC